MKPAASISVDLDNQWAYMKIHGDEGWDRFPSYLDVLIPLSLDFFAERNLHVTYFIVGKDATRESDAFAFERIPKAGHEVGNHSFEHEPWLHLYQEEEIEAEIVKAEEAILAVTGVRPRGFRGPGFSVSRNVLRVLHRRGYRYDASTFPTFLGPLARAYYFLQSNFDAAEREKRKLLFGSAREGLRPVSPYLWDLDGTELLELPVTTFPIFKSPFHLSYILYLSTFSTWLARTYFRAALAACRVTGVQPSLLLHPLDFLGADDVGSLAFFPGMKLPGAVKRARVSDYLHDYCQAFNPIPMGAFADAIQGGSSLPVKTTDTLVGQQVFG